MKPREHLKAWVSFLQVLEPQIAGGLELREAWLATSRLTGSLIPAPGGRETLSHFLERLQAEPDFEPERVWLASWNEIYRQGGPMAPYLRGLLEDAQGRLEEQFEAHCRRLPTRLNLVLLLFFVPPALALLFVPLVIEMINVFPH